MEKIQLFMLVTFICAVSITFYKLYLLFPSEPLEDDDTTEEATEELTRLMVDALIDLYESQGIYTTKALYAKVVNHEAFDAERFWRFNENRLHQLLQRYYLRHHVTDMPEIYRREKALRQD